MPTIQLWVLKKKSHQTMMFDFILEKKICTMSKSFGLIYYWHMRSDDSSKMKH